MARKPKCRHVEFIPDVTAYKPVGISHFCSEEVILRVEEIEAIRLKDYLGMEQEECAKKMQISRPTFQRILVEGRTKIAKALVDGRGLRIEGGDYCLGKASCQRRGRKEMKGCPYVDIESWGIKEENE
ncbi:MAG: DUF134 domain-containing protein [Syntrophomonadaceae bacterium]|jgi:predicted DNA-binding protein (UPF0251 family)